MTGRPTKLNEETIDEITTALMMGASLKIAAEYAGITERTLYLWQERGKSIHERLLAEEEKEDERLRQVAEIKLANRGKKEKNPVPKKYTGDFTIYEDEKPYLHFFQELTRAKAQGAITHLNFLYNLAPTDPNVSKWILERRYPEDFAPRPQQIEHSGRGGGAIETKETSDLTMEERAVRLLALLDTAKQRSETAQTAEGEQADAASDGAGAS